jgi:hypothetical protein
VRDQILRQGERGDDAEGEEQERHCRSRSLSKTLGSSFGLRSSFRAMSSGPWNRQKQKETCLPILTEEKEGTSMNGIAVVV